MGRGGITRADFDTLIPEAIKELIARKITPISYSKSTDSTDLEDDSDHSNSGHFEAWQRGCSYHLFMQQLTERKRIHDQLKDCDPEVIIQALDNHDKALHQFEER